MAENGAEHWQHHDWSAFYDDSGSIYYYNHVTDATTWDAPEKFNPPEKPADAKEKSTRNVGGWEELQDDQGDTYYFNPETEETTWDKPEGFREPQVVEGELEEKADNKKEEQEPNAMMNGGDAMDVKSEDDDDAPLPKSPVGFAASDEEEEEKLPSSPVVGADSDKKGVWEKHEDDDGNVFYCNTETDETTWDKPDEFDDDGDGENDVTTPDKPSVKVEQKSAGDSNGKVEPSASDENKATIKKWEKYQHDDGREYYYNSVTDETRWERPGDYQEEEETKVKEVDEKGKEKDEGAEAPAIATSGNWEKLIDNKGREYYCNTVTDVTQWDQPDDFVEAATDGDNQQSLSKDSQQAAADITPKKGAWGRYQDDQGREFYYNAASDETTWEKPDDYDPATDPTLAEQSFKKETGQPPSAWEKYQNDDGREYYYNAETNETQWDAPEGYVSPAKAADMEEQDEDEFDKSPSMVSSPQRSPSPESMEGVEAEMEEPEEKEEPEPEPEPEIDPAVKRFQDAEKALNQPDSVLEPGCTANVLEVVHNTGNPQTAIKALIDNFQGQTAICGTLARWLVDLRTASAASTETSEEADFKNFGVAPQKIADDIRDIAQDVINGVAKERFSNAGGDGILSLSKSEATFLEDMMDSSRWRKLLIDLSATNKESAVLMYCLRAISRRGHHREIAKRINQSEHFSVFNAMLQSELSVVGKTAVSAASDVDNSIGLEELVNDLRRTCTATAYTYLYSIEVLRHLVTLAEEDASASESLRFRRAMRKWERLSQDLDCAMVDPSTCTSASHLFRKRRLDVALIISELHQRQRRRLNPEANQIAPTLTDFDHQKKKMETGLVNFLRRYSVGTQVDDCVLESLLPSGLNAAAGSEVIGKLLIAHPLAIRALLSHIYKPGSTRVGPSTKSKCAKLIALAVIESEKKAIEEGGKAGLKLSAESDEVALTRMVVQGSQLCEEVGTMASFVVTTDPIEKGKPTTTGQQLCAVALKCAPVAQGTMLWARDITKGPEFLTSATYPTWSPCVLSLVRILAIQHACTRREASEVAFTFLRHSPTQEMSYKKVNELKEQALRLLIFLMVHGEAACVLRNISSRLQQQEGLKLDASLLRYFVSGLLEVVRPPYSLPFVRLFGAMLQIPQVVDAVKSSYFPDPSKEKLKELLLKFKESLSQATQVEASLVASLQKTYNS